MSTITRHRVSIPSGPGEPAWEIAERFPLQGDWTETAFLYHFVEGGVDRGIELVDGRIEVLPMPQLLHQRIQMFFIESLLLFVRPRQLGEVLSSGTKVKCRTDTIREPDVVFRRFGSDHAETKHYWEGAELLIEIVSPDDKSFDARSRDKKSDYARAGVEEYWVVDPQLMKVVVLKLSGKRYVTHAQAGEKGLLGSTVLKGFTVEAADVWASGTNARK